MHCYKSPCKGNGIVFQFSEFITHVYVLTSHIQALKKRFALMLRSQKQNQQYTDEDMMTIIDNSLIFLEDTSLASFD